MKTEAQREYQRQYQREYRRRVEAGEHIPNPFKAKTGPLSVYCQARWAQLQSDGYEWSELLQMAIKPHGLGRFDLAAPLPGDPAWRKACLI